MDVVVSDADPTLTRPAGRDTGSPRYGLRALVDGGAGMVSAVLLCVLLLLAFAAPLLPIQSDIEQHRDTILRGPSGAHWLGTDQLGRDIFSRTVYGIRTSVLVVGLSTLVCTVLGVGMGALSGFFGGLLDTVLMRVCDVVLGFPTVLVAIMVTAVLGPGAVNAGLALAVVGAPKFARVVRGEVQREASLTYVEAARSMGTRRRVILVRHIMPNVAGAVGVQVALFMAFAVIVEATLSFLGLGVQVPTPSLGSMLNEGRPYFATAWWYAVAPGAAIALLVLCINALSDRLGDVLDPRSHGVGPGGGTGRRAATVPETPTGSAGSAGTPGPAGMAGVAGSAREESADG